MWVSKAVVIMIMITITKKSSIVITWCVDHESAFVLAQECSMIGYGRYGQETFRNCVCERTLNI